MSLGYLCFKTLSIGLVRGSNPRTPALQSHPLPTAEPILPIIVLWGKGYGQKKPCDKSPDEYKPSLPAKSIPRIVHFLVVTYCEILNGKDIIRWVPFLRINSAVTTKTCRLQVQRYAQQLILLPDVNYLGYVPFFVMLKRWPYVVTFLS